MRPYAGGRQRKQIVGYVAPAVQEKIKRAADSRRISVALFVATAAEWFADYLAAPTAATLADLQRLGLPDLPAPAACRPELESTHETRRTTTK